MAAVVIETGELRALSRWLAERADELEWWRSRAARLCATAGRPLPAPVDDLARTVAVLRNRAADARVRATEAERSQQIDLAIREDFGANGFTPDPSFEGLDVDGKVSYYFLAQLAAAGWAVPDGWSGWSTDRRIAWFAEHGQDVRCSSAPVDWVCEHQADLLVVPEWALLLSSAVVLPEATASIAELLAVEEAIPLGFASRREFVAFGNRLLGGLAELGFTDVEAAFQGSSVTGYSFTTGLPFDYGRLSDFDIALSGDGLLTAAKDVPGLGLRTAGTRTAPLGMGHVLELGLQELSIELDGMAGRPVNFMVYRDIEAALARSLSRMVPT